MDNIKSPPLLICALLALGLAPAACGGVSPYIITPPAGQTNHTGDAVTFTVLAAGEVPLHYQWKRNNSDLVDAGNISGSTTNSLTLASITTADYGTYSVNITNAAGATNASATLTVLTRLVQNAGFESGSLAGWTISGNNRGISVQSPASGYVHSGSFGARIGPYGSLGYLSQTIPTEAGQTYAISFWLKNAGADPTNEFAVLWNNNTVLDLSNVAVFDWTSLQFSVLATTTNTVVAFGVQNDLSYFGLDDVSVLPIPACQNVTRTADGLAFTFEALAGFQYQLQSTTNLAMPGWSNDGNVVLFETNTTATISRTAILSKQFYRMAVLP